MVKINKSNRGFARTSLQPQPTLTSFTIIREYTRSGQRRLRGVLGLKHGEYLFVGRKPECLVLAVDQFAVHFDVEDASLATNHSWMPTSF